MSEPKPEIKVDDIVIATQHFGACKPGDVFLVEETLFGYEHGGFGGAWCQPITKGRILLPFDVLLPLPAEAGKHFRAAQAAHHYFFVVGLNVRGIAPDKYDTFDRSDAIT